jgi:hypothetical protein
MTLHTIGPTDMGEDEHKIGAAYQTWMGPFLVVAPLATAYFFDTKWVIAVGFAVALAQLHEAGGRLHDLCIRLRRTNIMIRERFQTETLL